MPQRPLSGIANFCEDRHLVAMEHDDVQDRASFVKYVAQLCAELDDPERLWAWENIELRTFLGAMAAWATDLGESANSNPWRHAADALTAAMVYE